MYCLDERRQFRRCGFAFTWAFGRVVASSTRVVSWGCAPGWYVSGLWPLGLGGLAGVFPTRDDEAVMNGLPPVDILNFSC